MHAAWPVSPSSKAEDFPLTLLGLESRLTFQATFQVLPVLCGKMSDKRFDSDRNGDEVAVD